MSEQARAAEHLRIIRSLMERATIYRAMSAPSALVGGTLSLLVAGSWVSYHQYSERAADLPPALLDRWFLWQWLGVLALTGASNLLFLHRDARRRGDPFLSPGMKLAISAMSPSLSVAAVLTILFVTQNYTRILAPMWVVLYGLALLSTAPFAPRSIERLGLVFLCAGLGVILMPAISVVAAPATNSVLFPHLLMGFTFGLFHIVYAACVWGARPTNADA